MSKFLSARFSSLTPYVPGEQPQNRQYVKLNTNESPFPPSPAVLEALSPREIERLHLYPDPDTKRAAQAIAAYYKLQAQNVLLGNGSDEILYFCFQAFCDSDVAPVFPSISYGFYAVYARILCLAPKIIPLSEDLSIDKRAYYNAGGTLIIANPNAPTGLALCLADIEDILANNARNVVIIDEAYVDFGAQSAVSLLNRYENLLVVQTMSKSRNLAGARLGFALGSAALIRDLNQMKFSFNPYNVNRLSLLAGQAAIEDEAYFRLCTGRIIKTRQFVTEALQKRGFDVLPSHANFVLAAHPKLSGKLYYTGLKEKGVLVRHFETPQIEAYVRITIGTQEQMQALLDATDALIDAT